MHLDYFENIDNFYLALKTLFEDLNIPVNYIAEEPARPRDILTNTFKENHPSFQLMDDVYSLGMVDDAAFEGNKSISTDKIKTDYDGLLLFGVTLKERGNGLLPTRSHLAEITRAFNREFHYTPVVVVFRYNQYIAFANAERQKYKQEWREGEKAGKVSLLRDVKPNNPHTGHLKILQELAIARTGRNAVNSFDGLYKYWQSVFNVSVLNREFYKELSNWYFWALKKVTFPGASIKADQNGLFKEDERVKEHNAKNLIRLLTRLLFVWFVKEKKLIPEELFDTSYIKEELLQEFQPQRLGNLFEEEAKGSTYYKSVLQNLFFATLNQTMGKREFRKDKQHMNVTNLMRYKSCFKDPEKFIKLVEDIVPFMNGGLFECLDQPHETIKGRQGGDKIIYIDGFSDRKDNELFVPDYLFFGTKEPVDLSEDYGSKNKVCKEAPVRGLINILNSYKFTITENTPIEEDVALDPELLGKVFENLLASYNPETKTTARKQTGSFYTPREIVNYMVDESLIAYFKNKLSGDIEDADELDTKLRQLISFDNIQPFQENKIKEKIIKAIDACSILDPACGSGAFPMGILQKMVHLLHKLDPGNERWKQRQIDKVNEAIEKAEEIEDSSRSQSIVKELKEQIKDIEDSFENNELDYGRKLYLLENCIYGVDIQSIAAQISKLRFFISLVVDQKVDKTKENFGIRPLPNLETKIVAANTLIGIEKPEKQGKLFDSSEVKKLEDSLKKVRHKIFNSKSPGRKRELRDEDKTLRDQIAKLLIDGGCENKTARQLASWDPYDQNASSPFFDPEWMFDIKDGFDVVMGNPPYKIVKPANTEKEILKKYFAYYSAAFKVNLYSLFLEKSLSLGKNPHSIHTYIVPDTSLNLPAFKNLRKLIAIDNSLKSISYYDEQIFENTEVGKSVILHYEKNKDNGNPIFKHFKSLNQYKWSKLDLNKVINDEYNRLTLKDGMTSKPFEILDTSKYFFGDFCDMYDGINPGSVELKNIFINDEKKEFSKKVIDGKDFHKYGPIIWSGDYVQYDSLLVEKVRNRLKSEGKSFTARIIKKVNFFEFNKIVTRQTSDTIIGSIDYIGYYTKNSVHSTLLKSKFRQDLTLETILLLYNSTIISWFYKAKSLESGRLFPQVKIDRLRKLPFPDLINVKKSSNILTLLSRLMIFTSDDTSCIGKVADFVVFELYFPDHMKEKEIDILKFVEQDLKEVLGEDNFEQLPNKQKENVIEKLHKRWSNPDSEIVKRMNSFAEKSPDILKPILESKQKM